MQNKKGISKEETLVGIVTPIQWDDHDQVTAVALSATDDEEYRIENGDQFINLVQKRIEAKGSVKHGKKASRSIAIQRFNMIESF